MKRFAIAAALLAVALAAVAATAGENGPAYTFTWSGYLKADVVWDQTRVTAGNYALYVTAPTDVNAEKNDVMSITARESRLGLDFSWTDGLYKTDAKVELDFYGLGVSSATASSQENKATSMLRHAYAQVTRGHWSLLAGQTSDVMSPLAPKTVNYTVCWDQGNIGYRRPQLRLSTWVKPSERAKVTLAVAAARTLGGDVDGASIDGIAVDDGADSGLPTFEGRLGLGLQMCDKGSLDLGFSGHYGRETRSTATAIDTLSAESWSVNADLKATFCARTELAGEFFLGKNLGTYFGGVGQTLNFIGEEIGAMGGWVQVSHSPVNRLWLNLGYGFDDPDEEDFGVAEGSTKTEKFFDKNSVVFGSVFYNLTSTVQTMLEVSWLETDYLYKVYDGDELLTDSHSFDDLRVQFALKAAIK